MKFALAYFHISSPSVLVPSSLSIGTGKASKPSSNGTERLSFSRIDIQHGFSGSTLPERMETQIHTYEISHQNEGKNLSAFLPTIFTDITDKVRQGPIARLVARLG